MPIVLLPTPRRVHITRENFALGETATLSLPRDTEAPVVEALREELEALFPELNRAGRDGETGATLRFARFEEACAELADVPEEARAEAFRLTVSPQGVAVEAGSPAGWMMAARSLRGLRERDELVGVTLLDWPSFPVRQVDLPWTAEALSEAALQQWLRLMALGRFNRLGLPGGRTEGALPAELQSQADRLGVTIEEPVTRATSRLVEQPTLFPAYSALLPALRDGAAAAETGGESRFVLLLGAVDAQTSLEALVYGMLFAGDCAWNPRKADLKLFRRWYAARRFGFDSRGPVQALDEMEAAASTLSGGAETALTAALEAEDPIEAPLFAALLRPAESAQAVGRRAAAALAALAPLQPDSEERAAALQGLQWTAQRLIMLSRRLLTAERVRELYQSAYAAAASPKAVSERLLRAADMLEKEARALDEHRAEWHALWRRERREPYDPEIEAAQRARVERFQTLAERMRTLRNQYIQTGALPAPTEEGLERPGTRLATGIQPGRLPPQPSPAWWPEGGAARMRIDIDSSDAAAGLVWDVQADFRALAGEAGAFNVRSARLLPLTEGDEAGPEQPCQLLRGGFAFVAQPGRHTYFLYLEPLLGPEAGFREARARQSRSGVRLENRRMRLHLSPAHGFLTAWHVLEPGVDLLPPEEELEDSGAPAAEWRLRVVETGPLLARARAEHPDGRIRQLDLAAGHRWAELSVNAPWDEFLLTVRPELWPEGSVALLGESEAVSRWPLIEIAAEATGVHWAAQQRPDGLTVAVLTPEATAAGAVARDGVRLWGRPHVGRVLLFAGVEQDPEAAMERLLAARRQPPRVRLGVMEERRVREF